MSQLASNPFESRVHAILNAAYNAPPGASLIPLDAVEYDAMLEFNTATHRFQPLEAGWYHIDLKLEAGVMVAGSLYTASMARNGVTILADSSINPTVNITRRSFTCSRVVRLIPTQFVDMRFQNSSVNNVQILNVATSYTYLNIHRIR